MAHEVGDTRLLEIGLEGTASLTVGDAHTAARLGSGRAPVFATPAMVALMEAAAVACADDRLKPGEETLGVHLDIEHIAPTPVGAQVSASAEIVGIDGRRVNFRVEAREGDKIIGRGTHARVIVDGARFRAKLNAR
jgi:predicted thioesterase